MTEIKIIPIFDQSVPGIWTDFAHICAETMRTNYNYKMDNAEIHESVIKDMKKWAHGTHFAFGAYDNGRMIGYIEGDATGRIATIQSLYVLFEYQKMGVGHRLLSHAERASVLFANRAELVSLVKSEMFYRRHGYQNVYSNSYAKPIIDAPRCECLPVFKCYRALANKFRALNPDFDAAVINTQHLPAFAYFDVDSNIIGCSVGNSVAVVPGHGLSKIVQNTLLRNIDRQR